MIVTTLLALAIGVFQTATPPTPVPSITPNSYVTPPSNGIPAIGTPLPTPSLGCAGVPLGFGTLTPSPDWLAGCGQCLPSSGGSVVLISSPDTTLQVYPDDTNPNMVHANYAFFSSQTGEYIDFTFDVTSPTGGILSYSIHYSNQGDVENNVSVYIDGGSDLAGNSSGTLTGTLSGASVHSVRVRTLATSVFAMQSSWTLAGSYTGGAVVSCPADNPAYSPTVSCQVRGGTGSCSCTNLGSDTWRCTGSVTNSVQWGYSGMNTSITGNNQTIYYRGTVTGFADCDSPVSGSTALGTFEWVMACYTKTYSSSNATITTYISTHSDLGYDGLPCQQPENQPTATPSTMCAMIDDSLDVSGSPAGSFEFGEIGAATCYDLFPYVHVGLSAISYVDFLPDEINIPGVTTCFQPYGVALRIMGYELPITSRVALVILLSALGFLVPTINLWGQRPARNGYRI